MPRSEALKEAQARYRAANKEKINYIRKKSAAKTFISSEATQEDVQEAKKWIAERERKDGK